MYILKKEIREVFVLDQNVSFKHIFGLRIFLCCFLNTSLVVRFREARLKLVVEFEYKGKHHVFCNTVKQMDIKFRLLRF
jgi:hypothetical protein